MNLLNQSFAADVERSFARQPIMNLIGARLSLVEPGVVEITLPYRADLTQQHRYLHAGIVNDHRRFSLWVCRLQLDACGLGGFER
jgi:hypothetical protein